MTRYVLTFILGLVFSHQVFASESSKYLVHCKDLSSRPMVEVYFHANRVFESDLFALQYSFHPSETVALFFGGEVTWFKPNRTSVRTVFWPMLGSTAVIRGNPRGQSGEDYFYFEGRAGAQSVDFEGEIYFRNANTRGRVVNAPATCKFTSLSSL